MILDNEEIFFLDFDADTSKALLYAPLRSYLALITKSTKDKILSGDLYSINSVLEVLKKRKYIDIKTLHTAIRKTAPELSIALTDNCNLKCVYCHASAGEEGKQSDMHLSLLNSLYNSYFNQITTKIARITFAGGGEPTYSKKHFIKAIELAKDISSNKSIQCEFRMATNGIFGNDLRKYIINNFSEISLSFDGPPQIHNLHRPLKDGSNSFEIVFETAKYFYEHKLSFAFRTTISNYSADYITDIVDFFAVHFPGKTLGLEPMNPYGRGQQDCIVEPPTKEKFSDAIVSAYQYASDKKINLVNAGIGKFDSLRTIFCGAVGLPSWTVSTDGSVSCCTRDNAPDIFKFGHFDEENQAIEIDQNKFKQIQNMNVFNYPECTDCFCKYHCAGDCPDLRISNLHNCDATKKIGAYVLNQKLIYQGGKNE